MLPALLEESGTDTGFLRTRGRLGAVLVVALCTVGLAACGGGERQDEGEPEGEFPVEITAAEFPPSQDLAETTDLTLSVENTGEDAVPNLAVTIFTIADPDTTEELDSEDAASSDEAEEVDPDELAEAVEEQLQEELEQAAEDEQASDEDTATQTTIEDAEEAEFSVADGPFSVLSAQPGLAIPSRPVWILEQGYPRLAETEPGPGPPGELAQASGAVTAQTNTFAFGTLEPGESLDLVWRVTPVQKGTYNVHYRIAAGLQGRAVAVSGDDSVPEGEFIVQISAAPPQTRVNDAGEVVPIKPGDIIGQAGSAAQQQELDEESTTTTP
jgi:hypothetical protein